MYSIVDSYFMPYGMECDLYNIMGEILECTKIQNILTGDTVYEMRICCNDIELDVCVNENDLLENRPEAEDLKELCGFKAM